MTCLLSSSLPPQVASCHFLADNYSSVLGACFEGPDGEEQCIHQMGGGLQVGGPQVVSLCTRVEQRDRTPQRWSAPAPGSIACPATPCPPTAPNRASWGWGTGWRAGINTTAQHISLAFDRRPPYLPPAAQAAALSGVALVHGDDAGLRLPPELAPIQVRQPSIGSRLPVAAQLDAPLGPDDPAPVGLHATFAPHHFCPAHHLRLPSLLPQAVIVPMWFGSSKSKVVLAEEAERLRRLLADAGIRAIVDGRRTRPGVRFGAADRCGATVRIEVRAAWG